MMRATRVPNGLSGVGFDGDDVPGLAEAATAQQRLLAVSPRPVGGEDLHQIYEAALRYW